MFRTNRAQLKQQLKKLERIKEVWDTPEYRKACTRAQKLSTHYLLDWADRALIDMGKAFFDYRKDGGEEILYDLRLAVSSLQAVTEELMARTSDQ